MHRAACEVDDSLRDALRGDIDSSMHSAVRTLTAGDADAVVSAGSTGALVALSRHLVGMLPGIRRPRDHEVAGRRRWPSIPDARSRRRTSDHPPNRLHQFALMGSAGNRERPWTPRKASRPFPPPVPTVGLLNIGFGGAQGTRYGAREAARLLEADDRLSYAGYVEPHRLFNAGTRRGGRRRVRGQYRRQGGRRRGADGALRPQTGAGRQFASPSRWAGVVLGGPFGSRAGCVQSAVVQRCQPSRYRGRGGQKPWWGGSGWIPAVRSGRPSMHWKRVLSSDS